MFSIFRNAKISLCALKVADNETLTGSTLNMQGYDSVAFIAGALKGEAMNYSIKAQQGAASDMSDAQDLAGTSTAFSTAVGTDGLACLEIVQPKEQYVRGLVIVPNVVTPNPTFLIALQFNAKDLPQSNTGEMHVSPAEGTA